MAIMMMALLGFTSCERVDAGHEGILVNLYGSDRGVDDVSLVTGMVWFNPFTQDVFEYPRKYRKDVPDIIGGPLFNHVRDAFRIQLNKFTTDEIVSMRDSLEKAVERQLVATLNREGFQLEQLTSGLKYPQTIVEAVNAKNKAVQEAQKAENEVKVAEAQARKLVVAAEAEAEANRLRQQALTPAILQKLWIEKWDGTVPTVMTSGNSQMFMDISKFK